MPGTLTRFRIDGLHEARTIDVTIENNRLVLVGDNGTGKSTLLDFVYSFLTKRWHRLMSYAFRSVHAEINGRLLTIERDELLSMYRDIVSSSGTRSLIELMDALSEPDRWELLEGRRIRGPVSSLAFRDLERSLGDETLSGDRIPENVRRAREEIDRAELGEVLYLPTYRRIEQDLSAIFPGQQSEVRQLRRSLEHQFDGEESVGLVRFGMEDVDSTILQVMNRLKDRARSSLTDLAWAFLRDLISGDDLPFDPSVIQQLEENTLEIMFSRIDERVLPVMQRRSLKQLVSRVKHSGQVEEKDRIAFGFLARLARLYAAQQDDEQNVRGFADMCNHYVVDKQMIYDGTKFTVSVLPTSEGGVTSLADGVRVIPLKALSSGEKQIVSLFSTLLLSTSAHYFLIIDEPELSLSVPWQRRLLPDVLATGQVRGLLAATHSPFIFENELDASTHSIGEFTEVADAPSS